MNFSNFRSWNRGQYYCKTENKHGTHNATAPLVTLKGRAGLFGAIGGAVAIVALVFPVVIVCMRRRNSIKGAEFRVESKEDNKSPVYDDISEMAQSHTAAQDTNRDDDEAVLYSTVETANSSSQEETLYSNIQKSHPKSEDEVQYASIMFSKPNAAPRSSEPKVEDDCVLYSTVTKHKT
ncbi:hypothetical protein JZ751_004723 [Albula glossodonta]|uniref:Uncharacterized protein n=1 Tax=Albula glossodonta TaxID=121402 RepID=A0A8T2NCG6_9TELE|nr:hypothetical protein JZ751_004723 [Albula glossodonta]